MIPDYWEAAKKHLRSADPVMAAVVDAYEDPPLRSKRDVFQTLVHAIVGQQISAKAADAVWMRFVTEVGEVTPQSIADRVLGARAALDQCDGVFVSCTALRAMETIAHLEQTIGKPVVSSNAATLWAVLRRLGIDTRGIPAGRLFDGTSRSPSAQVA